MNGIVSRRSAANVLGIVAIAVAVAGCDLGAASASSRQQKNGASGGEPRASLMERVRPGWFRGERPVLRYQMDSARGRLWALTADGVELYEVTTRQKVAQIALPGWLWVSDQYNCSPDLAIGPRGEAVISSNVVPTLWRIDPATLAASKHDLAIDEDTGKDVGFTGLAYSDQQGAFLAVSGLHGSLWRIDARLGRAQSIPLSAPLPKACGLDIPPHARDQRGGRPVSFCARGEQGDWAIRLAPDQRSGYVRPGQCMS